VGLSLKVIGCILLAISHQSTGLNISDDYHTPILYAGYCLFQIGGSFVLIPSWYIDTKYFVTAFYSLLAVIYYSSGGWIFCLFYYVLPKTLFYIPFGIFAIILFITFIIVLLFWPPTKKIPRDGYELIQSETEKKGDIDIPPFSQIIKTLHNYFLYLLSLSSILLVKGNFYWNSIDPDQTPLNYGFGVSSIGIIVIPLALVCEKASVYGNMCMVLILSILDSLLSFVFTVKYVGLVRILLYGIYVPYVLGMVVAGIRQKRLWAWFGYAMVPIGIITGGLSFISILLLENFNQAMEVRIREIVLLVVVVLLFAYPIFKNYYPLNK